MQSRTHPDVGFKRQVVFRLSVEDWPLLEAATREHGSIQAAVVAGLRLLSSPQADPAKPSAAAERRARRPRARKRETPAAGERPSPVAIDEEIPAREAARLLGLKTSTISGYIRSGRLPGRYDTAPGWRGWLTTREAVNAYWRTRDG